MKIRKTYTDMTSNGEGTSHESLRDVATLTSCMMHDFGNLLTLMSGHAELLSRSPLLAPGAREDVLSIRNAARRATHLVSRWMDFFKPASPHADSVDLRRIFAEVEALASPSLGPELELVSRVDSPLTVSTHREHLERTLLNLVLNARDAIGERGTISLVAEVCAFRDQHEGGVRITVEDTGPGIEPESVERIVDPFFTTKKNGSGLGLAQVLDFVREWEGSLEIETEKGVGTSFSLVLPRGREESCLGSPSEPPPGLKEGTILLVEPDAALAETLALVLESSGYGVISVSGPGDALLALERSERHVDAAIVDSNLEWMSSRELNKTLKRRYRGLPILVLSSSPFLRDSAADQILIKPFDGKTLPQELAALLDGSFHTSSRSETRIKALPVSAPLPFEDRKRG